MGHGFIYINLSICPPIFSPFIKNGRFLPVPCHNQEQFFYQYLNSLSYDSSSYLLNYSPLLQKVNWTFYQQCSQLFPYWFRIHPDMNITPKTNYLVNAGQENRTENQVFEKKEQKKMVLVRRNVHFKASNEYPPDVAASLQSGVESSSYVEVSNKQEKDLIEAVRNRRKAIKKCLRAKGVLIKKQRKEKSDQKDTMKHLPEETNSCLSNTDFQEFIEPKTELPFSKPVEAPVELEYVEKAVSLDGTSSISPAETTHQPIDQTFDNTLSKHESVEEEITTSAIQHESVEEEITTLAIQHESVEEEITTLDIQHESVEEEITTLDIQHESSVEPPELADDKAEELNIEAAKEPKVACTNESSDFKETSSGCEHVQSADIEPIEHLFTDALPDSHTPADNEFEPEGSSLDFKPVKSSKMESSSHPVEPMERFFSNEPAKSVKIQSNFEVNQKEELNIESSCSTTVSAKENSEVNTKACSNSGKTLISLHALKTEQLLNKYLSLGDKIILLYGSQELGAGSYIRGAHEYLIWADGEGHIRIQVFCAGISIKKL